MRRGATGRRPLSRRCRCNTPTTRCGSTRCWDRRTTARSAIAKQLASWTNTLEDLPDQIDLPADRPRPAESSYRGDVVPFALSPQLHEALVALARTSGASLFMVAAGSAGGLAHAAGQRPRYSDRQPDCRSHRQRTRRARGILRQHLGAAHRYQRPIRASASWSRGCVRPTCRPIATRTCRSSGWSRRSTPRARWHGTRCSRSC